MQASSECITQLILPDIRNLCKIPLFAQFLYQVEHPAIGGAQIMFLV